jgi:acetyl esterase/lipase
MALLNYLNMYLRDPEGKHMVPLPRAAVLLSPWVDLTCSSQSWEENKGLDFLPAKATDLHTHITDNFQHPVYSYCFGDRKSMNIQLHSPVGGKIRIPSFVGLNDLNSDKLKPLTKAQREDREWSESIGEKKRDALERIVRHPLISPVFGDFTGLPPILIVIYK